MSDQKKFKLILILTFSLILSSSCLITVIAEPSDSNWEFKEVAQVSTGGDTFQTEIVDDIAFVIDMDASLKTYDVSNPSRPELLDDFDDGGVPHHFVIEGDLLYLADHADGLEIYNISDPSGIDKLGSISDSGDGETDGVYVSDNIAYTAEWHDSTWSWKMVLINVTNPTSPQRISEYTDGDDEFVRFHVQDDVCYVACLQSGFKVLNVSEPHAITEIDVFDEGGYTWAIQIEENRAYISSTDFFILNLTDINNLTKIFNYTAENAVSPLLIEENLAYLGVHDIGLEVLNISVEESPELIGTYNQDNIVGIAKSGEYIYLSCHGDGLIILKIQNGLVIDSYSTLFILISSIIAITSIVVLVKRKK